MQDNRRRHLNGRETVLPIAQHWSGSGSARKGGRAARGRWDARRAGLVVSALILIALVACAGGNWVMMASWNARVDGPAESSHLRVAAQAPAPTTTPPGETGAATVD